MRLVPHAIHATQTGAKRLFTLSGDTDVMVLARYFNKWPLRVMDACWCG